MKQVLQIPRKFLRKTYLLTIIGLSLIMLLNSCNSDNDTEPENQNAIEIISVSPNENLIDGEEYTFQIEIEYNLQTFDEALISTAFNYNGVSTYRYDLRSVIVVEEGKGTRIIESTSIVKDWKNEGDFRVLVSMYESVVVEDEENPRDPQEVASDRYTLNFK